MIGFPHLHHPATPFPPIAAVPFDRLSGENSSYDQISAYPSDLSSSKDSPHSLNLLTKYAPLTTGHQHSLAATLRQIQPPSTFF